MVRIGHRNTVRGFTIIELMVSIGILAALAAIVAPRWEEYRARMITAEAATRVCTAFREFREEALAEQCVMRMDIDNSDHTIKAVRLDGSNEIGVYKEYKFSNEVNICGTASVSLTIGRGGFVTSSISTETMAGFSGVSVYVIDCAAKVAAVTNTVYITKDGRASIGEGN